MRAVLSILALTLTGCSPFDAALPGQTAWVDRVPQAPSEVVAAQPILARGPDSITLAPISPAGAAVGVDYAYDMPHCGINSPIDVDGSFWDSIGLIRTSTRFDGQTGTFRLISPTEATFTSLRGDILALVRHSGAKAFRLCS